VMTNPPVQQIGYNLCGPRWPYEPVAPDPILSPGRYDNAPMGRPGVRCRPEGGAAPRNSRAAVDTKA
jgi:hypothetical protein